MNASTHFARGRGTRTSLLMEEKSHSCPFEVFLETEHEAEGSRQEPPIPGTLPSQSAGRDQGTGDSSGSI